ncbi:MAG: ABC transporter permease subunit [Spirochaetales bacterium]|nr:ABC transporter permease subunit [Spirochaetales bacterium]
MKKGLLPGLAVLLLWQILFMSGFFSPLVFPSPLAVAESLYGDLKTGELVLSILFSLAIILGSFLPSLILAFFLAWLAFRYRSFDPWIEKLSALVHPLPGIALLPLLILWTGLGTHIIVLIVIHSVLWPFYINIRSGFRQVPGVWLDVADNNRLSEGERFLSLLVPASFPQIFAGLKIGWSRAWRAVISAEMIFGTIGSGGGLGWFIYNKRIFMDTPGMYGGVIILMLIGLAVENLLFRSVERRIAYVYSQS